MKAFFEELGEHLFFLKDVLLSAFKDKFEWREFLIQISQISWRSLSTTLTAGIFVGAIMAIQFYLQIKDFGATSVLGGLSTSGTIREVGPVLIAFMLAGKVGAFTSAELGTMKVTDQLEALRCLGINPISFLIVPRFIAVIISSVILLSFGLFISVIGGLLASYFNSNINFQEYLIAIPRFTNASAVLIAITKAVVFGFLMGHICCANGFWAKGGSQGVGIAVRKTAVQSMVCIVLSDFAVTWMMNGFLKLIGLDS